MRLILVHLSDWICLRDSFNRISEHKIVEIKLQLFNEMGIGCSERKLLSMVRFLPKKRAFKG